MYLSQKHLSRRTVLKGVGVTMALPWMESLNVWGDTPPDADVLRAHIYALRAAIDKPFERKLLLTVHGTGYRLTDAESA